MEPEHSQDHIPPGRSDATAPVDSPGCNAERSQARAGVVGRFGVVSCAGVGRAAPPVCEAPAGRPAPSSDASSFLMYEVKSLQPCQEKSYGTNLESESNLSTVRFPERLERLGKAKTRSAAMAEWMGSVVGAEDEDDELSSRAGKLRRCGDYLLFRQYLAVEQVRLHAAHFCQQDRLCPLCASRRGAKLLRRYTERVMAVRLERPSLRGYMVTHTIRDGADLGERFKHLTVAYGRMMSRRRNARNRGARTEAAKAVGAVHSIEVKRGQNSGEWHPHVHAVWLCEDEPDLDLLRSEWKELTGDSHVVDVRPFHCMLDGVQRTNDELSVALAGDMSEVFKYALKMSDLSFGDNWTAFMGLRRRRLVGSYGALFGVEVPADLLDSPLDVSDLPYVELLYSYAPWAKGYQGRNARAFCA